MNNLQRGLLLLLLCLTALGCREDVRAEKSGNPDRSGGVVEASIDSAPLQHISITIAEDLGVAARESMPAIAVGEGGVYAVWRSGMQLMLAQCADPVPTAESGWETHVAVEEKQSAPMFPDIRLHAGQPVLCYSVFHSDYGEDFMPRILDSRLDMLRASSPAPSSAASWQRTNVARGDGPYLYGRIAGTANSVGLAYIHKIDGSGGHGMTEEGELWDVRNHRMHFARLAQAQDSLAPSPSIHRPLQDPSERDFFSGEAADSGSGLSLSYVEAMPFMAWVAQDLSVPMVGLATTADPQDHSDWLSYRLLPEVRSFNYIDAAVAAGRPMILCVDGRGAFTRFGEKTAEPATLVFGFSADSLPQNAAAWHFIRHEAYNFGFGYRCIEWGGRPTLIFSSTEAGVGGDAAVNAATRLRVLRAKDAQPTEFADFKEVFSAAKGSSCFGLDAAVLPDGSLAVAWMDGSEDLLRLELLSVPEDSGTV